MPIPETASAGIRAAGDVRRTSDLPRALRRCSSVAEYRERQAASYSMRGLAPLPLHVEEMIEDAISSVGVERLAFVNMLIGKNLTLPLSNWLAVPKLTQNRRSKSGQVRRSMRLKTRHDNVLPDYDSVSWPIPATIGEFEMGSRELAEAERYGLALDTAEIAELTRRWQEAVEEQALNGWVDEAGGLVKVAGNTLPGIFNAPSANSQQFVGDAAGRGWDDAAKTGAGIFADLMKGISVLQGDNYFGRIAMVVGTAYGNVLANDFKALGDETIAERLMKAPQLEAIVIADRAPANKVALVTLQTNVIDVVIGEDATPVTAIDDFGWEADGAVVGCMVTRVKSDYDGNSGIVVLHT